MGFKMMGSSTFSEIFDFSQLSERIEYLRDASHGESYPSEIYLKSDDDFAKFETLPHFGDSEGPYFWYCAIKIRPPVKKEIWIW